MRGSPQRAISSIAILGPMFLHFNAHATEWEGSVAGGVLHTDNLDRSPRGHDANIDEFAGDFYVQKITERLTVDADGGVIWRRFQDEPFENDVLPQLRALLDVDLKPDRLSFRVTENFGQRARIPNDSLLPEDREDVNIFAFGPDAKWVLGDTASFVTASARASRMEYEKSPLDGDKLAARVGFERVIGPHVSWSINGSDGTTRYDDLDTGFDVKAMFFSTTVINSRVNVYVETGWQQLDDEGGPRDGFYLDLNAKRQLSDHSSVALNAVNRFADTSDVFVRRQDLEPDIDTTIDVLPRGRPLREKLMDLSYSWRGRRTNILLGALLFNEQFIGDEQDADRSGRRVDASMLFFVHPRFQIDARVYTSREAPEIGQAIRDGSSQLALGWKLSRTVDLTVGAEHYSRRGSTALNYEENRLFATLAWQARGGTNPTSFAPRESPIQRRSNVRGNSALASPAK
jgi:hypothetical protein